MPKLIDYPRTSYAGAWEVSDVVDDTGGKCALETCARKLNRKVSGSFKAIVGSAVKFGLLTSKRELLTTTTLFRRIKHAYDKQEELLFHREAFLTPPLFTQLCRKFRSRELPVQMLDIMLIREFDVEEINAQSVAKAFIDGARMVGLLDERNLIADIDQLAAQQPPRRELASPELSTNSFRAEVARSNAAALTPSPDPEPLFAPSSLPATKPMPAQEAPASPDAAAPASTNPASASIGIDELSGRPPLRGADAVANLFGLTAGTQPATQPGTRAFAAEAIHTADTTPAGHVAAEDRDDAAPATSKPVYPSAAAVPGKTTPPLSVKRPESASSTDRSVAIPTSSAPPALTGGFRIELSGPGLNTVLEVQDEDDLALARVLLDKIGRQLKK